MEHGERFNTATHFAGLLLAAAGAVALLQKAQASGDDWKIGAATGFGLSMLFLYAASTLYHGSGSARKARWAVLDHCAIYALIAGTYLPFALVTLRGLWGGVLLGLVALMALAGICNELLRARRAPPPLWLYVANGWIGVAALVPAIWQLDAGGVAGLLAGALLYSAGVWFYRFGERVKHAHGIWHLFVLGGTASHYFTVLIFVI